MLSPDTRPRPESPRLRAIKTSWPRPGAPTSDAMTTMARAIITGWFTPSAISGSATGSCTCQTICRRVTPIILAASVSSPGTLRMPSSP